MIMGFSNRGLLGAKLVCFWSDYKVFLPFSKSLYHTKLHKTFGVTAENDASG